MTPPANNFQPGTIANVHRTLSIVRIAMAMGCLLFLGISTYLVDVEKIPISNQVPFEYMLVAICALVIVSSMARRMISAKRFTAINDIESPKEKLMQFRSIMILNFALIEVPVLGSVLAYFLTGNKIFLFLTPLLIIQFFLLKFDPATIQARLNLGTSELEELQ